MENQQNIGSGGVPEAIRDESRVTTPWRFTRRPIPGGGTHFEIQELSSSTATMVLTAALILQQEVRRIIPLARHRELPMAVVRDFAPNLNHWLEEKELLSLLDGCSPIDDGDETPTENLDQLGRRKHVAVVSYIDKLMGTRLGCLVSTIRSYREREARRRAKQ
jgi:hypothetical protein